jgi:hypothetical protein
MRLNALKQLKNRKVILIGFLVLVSFFVAPQTLAGFSDWAGQVVGNIIYLFIWALGLIVMLVMRVLLMVVSFQNFIEAQAVVEGWVIVRDLANMFFVVILLVIAFATILHIESYNYKKWLPKLILMAVLINFSKTICGLLIDVAQIVMLTFVNSFKDVAAGNFVDMLGIKSVVTFAKQTDTHGFWAIVGAYFLGFIYMLIALVVLTTMLMVLTMRIVMIWIYVVLSPLAYLLSAFPGGAQYASKWWKDFIGNLIVGPVLAFFIWLSFAALQTGHDLGFATPIKEESGFVTNEEHNSPTMVTEASSPGVLIKFIIGIGMLIGGLKIAQEVGGAAGSIAGKGMNKLNSMGAMTAGGIGGFALGRARWAGRKLDQGQMAFQEKLGVTKPVSLNPTLIKKGWQAHSDDAKEKYYDKAGGPGEWQDKFEKYTNPEQYLSIRKGKKSRDKDLDEAAQLTTQKQNELSILNNREKNELGILNNREQLLNLPDDKRKEKLDYYNKNEEAIVDGYIKRDVSDKSEKDKKALAEENYNADIDALEATGAGGNIDRIANEITTQKTEVQSRTATQKAEVESRISEQKINKLNDPRAYIKNMPVGFSQHVFKPTHGVQASQEREEKIEREIGRHTRGDSFALVDQLIKAINEKDSTRAAMSFKLLAKNNDLNEASKDPRLIRLMTKNNGILNRMASQGIFGTEGAKDVDTIKDDYAKNPADPVYVQAMIQGILSESGAKQDVAARQANDIGHTSFSAGSPLAYAIAEGNASSGDFEFSKMKYEKDKGLKIDKSRVQATIGKLNTAESQMKMRNLHPNTLIIEGADGNANGLCDTGTEFLKTMTSLDLGHMNRVRPDLLKKFGNSSETMKQAIELANKLAAEGDESQANNIKYFVGYIQSKKNAQAGVKDFAEVSKAFTEAEAEYK